MRLKLLVVVILFCSAAPAVAQPADSQFDGAFSTDLPLAESKEAIHRVVLKCQLADGGKGTLTLDPSVPKFNEFGESVAGGKQSPVMTLDCTLKLVKKDEGRQLYEIRGPKIVSRLSFAIFKDTFPWGEARLLVQGKGGEVKYVIDLVLPREKRTPPCHPGCFPAGTTVRVPDGTKAIERVREGDLVTTIDADGKPSPAKVTGVFVTRNRVLEVRAEGGKLVTTETQPVGLEGGGFRPAGELKVGDRIWRWVGAERRAVAVLGVSPADREVQVFNLVLGEPKAFIAGDFLVRSKPPVGQASPGPGAAVEVAPNDCAGDGKAPVRDAQPIEGLWFGSWGGGERGDGVIFLPVVAELFIKGDRVEWCGFRNVSRLTGTVRFDEQTKQMRITPKAEAGGPPTPKTIDYAYDIKGDKLTLTDSDKVSISLQKHRVAQNPLANAQVELVAATGINHTGDLLVTEFTELRVGRAGATYFRPENRSHKTKQATILLVQETGLKKVTVAEARGLIRESTPVAVTFRQSDRSSSPQLHELWKDMGSPMPDGDAVRQTYARILKPGTLVFILSARENAPVP